MKIKYPLLLIALCWANFSLFAAEPQKPNIIFVLADDLGIDGVSCYGADAHKTPRIDALAASGLRFQTCYAAPLCGPSRCLLMTGPLCLSHRRNHQRLVACGRTGRKVRGRIPDGQAHEAGRLCHRASRQMAAGRRVAGRLGV